MISPEELTSLLKKHMTDHSALNALVQLIGRNGNVAEVTTILDSIAQQERVPNLSRVTSAGNIGVKVFSFSVYNSGAANAILLSSIIKPGESLNFGAGDMGNFYPAGTITYDATGTELVFIYNTAP